MSRLHFTQKCPFYSRKRRVTVRKKIAEKDKVQDRPGFNVWEFTLERIAPDISKPK